MNVREDKMTYQFGLKIILFLCVPVLFRIIMAYFIISDIFQDTVLIKNSCFWKMKANCASVFFLADKVIFVRIFFSSIIDASIKLVRSLP